MEIGGLKFVMEDEPTPQTKIRVFGVGGGGCNAVARMLSEGLAGVDFVVRASSPSELKSPTDWARGLTLQQDARPRLKTRSASSICWKVRIWSLSPSA